VPNQPCKICNGTGNVTCPNQTCDHWCECTVCNGTGKVEIVEDWSKGHLEEKVRAKLEYNECPACQGTGKPQCVMDEEIYGYCGGCGGSGQVIKQHPELLEVDKR